MVACGCASVERCAWSRWTPNGWSPPTRRRAELRGVRIDRCSDTITAALGSLAADVPVVVTPDALDEERHSLPKLQPGSQHLALVPLAGLDLSLLATMTALQSLTLGSGMFDDPPTHLDDIAHCA
jgi:hypothetical protein